MLKTAKQAKGRGAPPRSSGPDDESAQLHWAAAVDLGGQLTVGDDGFGDLSYTADFVTNEQAAYLKTAIEENQFETLFGRQLQNWGGVPHPSGTILEPLPLFLRQLGAKLVSSGVFEEPPNQALVNKYENGQGIAPHADGPNFKSKAAIISLGSSAVLRFHHNSAVIARVLLEPNSLLVFSGDAFDKLKHSIEETTMEPLNPCDNLHLLGNPNPPNTITRGEVRISITLRHVSKIYKVVDEIDLIDPQLRTEMARRKQWWKQAISQ